MTQITNHTADTAGEIQSGTKSLYTLWERARRATGEPMTFSEFSANWETLDTEDRADVVTALEQIERLNAGEESASPFEETSEPDGLCV